MFRQRSVDHQPKPVFFEAKNDTRVYVLRPKPQLVEHERDRIAQAATPTRMCTACYPSTTLLEGPKTHSKPAFGPKTAREGLIKSRSSRPRPPDGDLGTQIEQKRRGSNKLAMLPTERTRPSARQPLSTEVPNHRHIIVLCCRNSSGRRRWLLHCALRRRPPKSPCDENASLLVKTVESLRSASPIPKHQQDLPLVGTEAPSVRSLRTARRSELHSECGKCLHGSQSEDRLHA